MLAVSDLSKTYGGTVALDGVTLAFERGTVHAVLGENGSGKSTLVKLLSGVVAPTRGTVTIESRPVHRFEPAAVQALGLATVFQEVLVAPDRSVADNILLGCDSLFRRRLARTQRRAAAAAALGPITRTPIDLDAPAGRLPLALRQLVVLARALARRPRILILDEATAALDLADREAVFQTIEAMARGGGLVLFISHRMDEVMRLADRVTILRNGRVVETLERGTATPDLMLRLMAPAAAAELGHAG
ncbi:MAG: sugar ABC transporter ATP-binding protein [Rhodospirillaceae bacterium]|nr:sugar ABC transporter ATP-binding protein [Rhodospirillaceae bacterium]